MPRITFAGPKIARPWSGRMAKIVAATFVVFGMDVLLPDGVVIIVCYLIVVMITDRLPRRGNVVAVAACCASLTIAGYFARHGSTLYPHFVWRRALCVVSIGIAAILSLHNQSVWRERLEKSELLHLLGDAMFTRDLKGMVTWWSRGAEALFGWSASEAVGRQVETLMGAPPPALAVIPAGLVGSGGRWHGQLTYRTRDGRTIVTSSTWMADAASQSILETNVDITADRQVEIALRTSEERFRRLFDMSEAAIWEEDYSEVRELLSRHRQDGVQDFGSWFRLNPDLAHEAMTKVRVTDVNQTAVEMFEATGKRDLMDGLEHVFLPETIDSFIVLLAALAEGRPSCSAETTVRTLTGRRLTILMTVRFPPPGHSVANVLVGIMDITERRGAEERLHETRLELARATRVATLGALTSSIAQDIERPLALAIDHGQTSLGHLLAETPDVGSAARSLSLVAQEARRAAEIVARVRGFLRKNYDETSTFDMRAAVETACNLVQRELTIQGAQLRLDLPIRIMLAGDRGRVEHVIVHVLLSGIEALSPVQAQQRRLLVRLYETADQAVLEVVSSGGKLPRPHAELPFGSIFPTKEGFPERDLGLAMCQTSVEADGWRLTAEQESAGSVIKLVLPLRATA